MIKDSLKWPYTLLHIGALSVMLSLVVNNSVILDTIARLLKNKANHI